jgi:hypothetical protein
VLDVAQSFAIGAAVELDCPQPRFGIGVARCARTKGGFGGGEIAGAIALDRGAQRRRDIGRADLLAVRDAAYGEQRREQRYPQRDHFVLKV